jgi:chromosome partitioning protein
VTRIIATANQKGGVGKTTLAINLSGGLVRANPDNRVLLVDADPQANATAVMLGIPFAAGPRTDAETLYEVLVKELPAIEAIHRIELAGDTTGVLDILPSHLDLASAELELVNIFERERRLRRALEPVQDSYDYIIIDCPPSLGLLTLNALMAATEVLIPVDPGIFPIIGLNLLNRTIEMVRQSNPVLHVLGVVPSLQDRTALSRDTLDQLQLAFGDKLLPAIPRRVSIGEAHAAGQDIFVYDTNGDGAEAFSALLQEVIRRG